MTAARNFRAILAAAALLAALGVPAAFAQTAEQPAAPAPAPRPRVVPFDLATPPAQIVPPVQALAAPAPSVAATPARQVPFEVKRPVTRPQAGAETKADGVITLAVNKTMPIDLPTGARDVVLGNPAIADVLMQAPRRVFLMGRSVGDTNVFFVDENGGLIRRVELHVGPDSEGAQAAIGKVLPDDDIRVSAIGDALFLAGKARNPDAANLARAVARRFVAADSNIVNQITVSGSQQVLLKVRVAEMSRSVVKELGLQGTFAAGAASFTGGFLFSQTTPTGLAGSLTKGNFGLNISALESEGLVKTLAEPNLTTLSGEVARLLAGGEEPVPTANTNGVVTVEWKPFGVGLVFSPTILSNGRISLKVESEVSSIDKTIAIPAGQGIIIFGLKTRRANSVIELPSGGSMMMAGLLQNDDTENLNSVPGARDIPILGQLLGSTQFQRGETELVVTITAYVVEPVDNKSLSLPTDGFVPSSDLRRYFLMKLQENYVGKRADLPNAVLQGPYGYIVE